MPYLFEYVICWLYALSFYVMLVICPIFLSSKRFLVCQFCKSRIFGLINPLHPLFFGPEPSYMGVSLPGYIFNRSNKKMTRIKNTGERFFVLPKRIIFANCISEKSKKNKIEIAKIKSTRVTGLF